MQTCFFALSGVLPAQEAIAQIKKAIEKTYSKKGEEVVQPQFRRGRSHAGASLRGQGAGTCLRDLVPRPPLVPDQAPDFVKRVTAVMMAGQGDLLPVSAFPVDGTWPTGTARWEKRTIAEEVPIWDPKVCIQCNKCALVCPHAAIRAKVYEPGDLQGARPVFKSTDYRAAEFKGWKYTIQVAPQDCTGCNLCVMVCPAKDKSAPRHKAINMEPLAPVLERGEDQLRLLPPHPRSPARADQPRRCQELAVPACRCLNTPAPAPAAARRRTSSCSRSSSAIGC